MYSAARGRPRPARAEHRQHRAEQPEQHRRKTPRSSRAAAAPCRKSTCAASAPPRAPANGAADRTGEADARADSLQQRRCRIGKRDGSETEVAERLADENPSTIVYRPESANASTDGEHIGRKKSHAELSSFDHFRFLFKDHVLNSAIASIISLHARITHAGKDGVLECIAARAARGRGPSGGREGSVLRAGRRWRG